MEDKNLDQKLSDNHPEETKVLDTNTEVADKPKSKKKKKQSFIHYLIPTVLFISMIVFGGLFLRDFLEYRAAEDEYASLQDHIVISEEPKKEASKKEKVSEDEFDDEAEEEPVDLLHPHFQIDYGALSGVNADFTAVLHVPALSITYPVVKSKDNEEYLHRTFEGKANFAGSIFLDANAKGSYDHKNTFIFGHNMKNGTMFGKLKYFLRDEQLANSNPYVFLCRPEGITRYRIFSYYLTTVESPIYNDFEGDKGYDQYLSLVQRLSSYRNYPKDSIDFSQRPDIITLSTCSGPSGGNQRFIVQAALEEVYQNG
ncbi:class B sortase [Oribacterium sinus]|uniref:class B sortase n=1 Tax=Oribacterium sinus TaxID=237576 RepID=UPI0028E6BD44|nr:class B sortase [Oribacterium sinus]